MASFLCGKQNYLESEGYNACAGKMYGPVRIAVANVYNQNNNLDK
jgi:hypothetical protein